MIKAFVFVSAGMILTTSASAQQDAQRWDYSLKLGRSESKGKYGGDLETRTETTDLTASAFYGGWALDLNLPYTRLIQQTVVGRRGVILGPGGRPIGGARLGRGAQVIETSAEGLGDATTSVTHTFYGANKESWNVDLGGTVKFSTGDTAKGLSTGEKDYTLYTGAFRSFGNLSANLAAGRTWLGDPPGTVYRNPWYWSADAGYDLTPHWRIGSGYSYEQSATGDSANPRAVSLSLRYKLNDTWRLQGKVSKGISDGSPDLSGGLSLTANF